MRIADERMIEALLTTKNITKCAEVLGCNRKSIYDRLKKPEFYAKLQQERKNAFALASTQITDAQSTAVGTLVNIMCDESASAMVRVKASQAILDIALKTIQMTDIVDEIAELKKVLKEREIM